MPVVAVVGADHGADGRDDRAGADRHQEGAGLLDRQPARLHVPGLRRRRLRRRRLPPVHARLLQGAAVPRLGLGDPRAVGRAGHAQDGRAAQARSRGRSPRSRSAPPTIAGIPFLAGFFSKDEILLHALVRERLPLFAIGLFTAVLTAFYMSRLLFLTFFGEFRGDHEAEHHVHESPWSMLVPLVAAGDRLLRGGADPHPAVRAPGRSLARRGARSWSRSGSRTP